MKDHQVRELVDHLRDLALAYHDHESLRERIAEVVISAFLLGDVTASLPKIDVATFVSKRRANSREVPSGWSIRRELGERGHPSILISHPALGSFRVFDNPFRVVNFQSMLIALCEDILGDRDELPSTAGDKLAAALMLSSEPTPASRPALDGSLDSSTALPTIHIKCETVTEGPQGLTLVGTTSLPTIRVEKNDDESFTVVSNYWPVDSGVVIPLPGKSQGNEDSYRSMKSAPKDGTVILVRLEDSDIPYPARWIAGATDFNATELTDGPGWYMTWDGSKINPVTDGPRDWMPIPQ